MEKEKQASLMHDLRLGKGERHAHKMSQRLSQRGIPPLHMSGFSGLAGLLPYGVLKAITALYAAQKSVKQ